MKKQRYLIVSFVSVILFFSSIPLTFAQSIPITLSGSMDKVVFDGRWSFAKEWKASSLESIKAEGGSIYIRTAHLKNDIFVMLDVVLDQTPSSDDLAVVCIGNTQNTTKHEKNNYCFKQNLNVKEHSIFRWQLNMENFEKSEYHNRLIVIGSTSDEQDRYSIVSHPSYEFKIPLEPIGRYDRYGFFVGVYDAEKSVSYTWPDGIDVDLSSEFIPPNEWGLIYSPDKSLPEYELPILILIVSIVMVIFVSSKICRLNFSFQNR